MPRYFSESVAREPPQEHASSSLSSRLSVFPLGWSIFATLAKFLDVTGEGKARFKALGLDIRAARVNDRLGYVCVRMCLSGKLFEMEFSSHLLFCLTSALIQTTFLPFGLDPRGLSTVALAGITFRK